jgi:hypothetical protein
MRQATKLRMDDRRELGEGELVAVAPGAQQLTDVVQEGIVLLLDSFFVPRLGWPLAAGFEQTSL